jgi:hypothetical protein
VRIVHEARRQVGSAAPLAILEFVDRPAPAEGETAGAEAAEAGKGGKGTKPAAKSKAGAKARPEKKTKKAAAS